MGTNGPLYGTLWPYLVLVNDYRDANPVGEGSASMDDREAS